MVVAAALGLACGARGTSSGPSPTDEPEERAEVVTNPEPEPEPISAREAEPRIRATFGERVLEVALELEAETIMVSEPIEAEVVFSGDVTVGLGWLGRNRLGRPVNYDLILRNAAGEALPQPELGLSMGGQNWWTTLRDQPARQFLLLPNWYEGLRPGRYSVEVTTTIEVYEGEAREGGGTPFEVALRRPLEVVPDDPERLAARIEALGQQARDTSHETSIRAVRKLERLEHALVLDIWLELAARPDYPHRFQAIRALSAYDDRRVVEVLWAAGRTEAKQLPAEGYTNDSLRESAASQARVSAAQALAECPHADAYEALLGLRNDDSESVRLSVLHAVAKREGEAALALLRVFADDPSTMVRDEAARYLRERGESP